MIFDDDPGGKPAVAAKKARRRPPKAEPESKPRRVSRIVRGGPPRVCIVCVLRELPRESWGSWTWEFGDCRCGHFGITVLATDLADQVAVRGQPRVAEQQVEIELDNE